MPENKHWLGAAPLPDIAKQILECHGQSGPNAEYLLRLADFMREEIPEALDEHLFSLERLVRKFASDMKICLRTLMGEEPQEEKQEVKAVVPSYQFASRIPEKKLRCVNMWYMSQVRSPWTIWIVIVTLLASVVDEMLTEVNSYGLTIIL